MLDKSLQFDTFVLYVFWKRLYIMPFISVLFSAIFLLLHFVLTSTMWVFIKYCSITTFIYVPLKGTSHWKKIWLVCGRNTNTTTLIINQKYLWNDFRNIKYSKFLLKYISFDYGLLSFPFNFPLLDWNFPFSSNLSLFKIRFLVAANKVCIDFVSMSRFFNLDLGKYWTLGTSGAVAEG